MQAPLDGTSQNPKIRLFPCSLYGANLGIIVENSKQTSDDALVRTLHERGGGSPLLTIDGWVNNVLLVFDGITHSKSGG